MLITVILLYSCIATPVQIALYDELDGVGKRLNQIVDSLFLIDIIIIFNSAIYDEDFEIVDNRQEIVKDYFKGWFFIDVFAIFPFEMVMPSNGEAANLVRFIRIGRITKLLKLMKLMRLMRLQKEGSFNIMAFAQEILNIN